MSLRIGIDVGGTFTDGILIDEDSGSFTIAKVPSTPSDPSDGFMTAVRRLVEDHQAVGWTDMEYLVHATTVVTNAVIEGKTSRSAFLVTAGFRDLLEIGRQTRSSLYDPQFQKLPPLVPRRHVFEIPERLDAQGRVVRPLDLATVSDIARRLVEQGIETVAVCLLHSYRNPDHEQRVAEVLTVEAPGLMVSLSSDVAPEFREYVRASTTVINAAVRPPVARYLGRISRQVADAGAEAGLFMMQSNGGVTDFASAAERPVSMVESGPAAGVIAARSVARALGTPDAFSFDMGGTTAKVGLIQGGEPRVVKDYEVGAVARAAGRGGSGYPIRTPVVDLVEIGAGGGSIAWIDEGRGLRVGPTSAGADPGPVCYRRGGEQPTVTDANVVLGYLPPSLLGGEMALDVDAATAAVTTIADAMDVDVKRAAAGIVDIVNENMFGALRLVSVQQGYDPRDFALVAFGGAGPLHANALGRLMGSWPVIIPPSPGVLCAYGDATTRLRNEAARTFIRRFSETSDEQVAGILRELEAEASHAVAADGDRDDDGTTTRFQVDVRYHGQGFELPVEVDVDGFALEQVGAEFDTEHEQLFTFALDAEHEIVNLRAVVLSSESTVEAEHIDAGDDDPAAAATGTTSVYVDGRDVDATLYDRAALRAGNRIAGPAIVTEMDSTTLVLPGHTGEVDQFGNILVRPDGDAGPDHVGADTEEA